jgi:hypothetical protein
MRHHLGRDQENDHVDTNDLSGASLVGGYRHVLHLQIPDAGRTRCQL